MSIAPAEAAAAPRLRRRVGVSGIGVLGYACVAVIVLAVLVAIAGPWLAPHDPEAVNLLKGYSGPDAGHLLGYDNQGRDLLSRLLVGARTSLVGPLLVVLASVTIGASLAMAAAWRGGRFDLLVGSALDMLFAFPGILFAILAAAVFGSGLTAAAIALSIAYMPYVARVLRGACLRERTQAYVAALEVQGASGTEICARHLLPNVLPLIVAQGTILFGYAMVDLAAISFIGLGVQAPHPDWGVMISEGKSGVLEGHPATSLYAGLCIVVVVIAVNLLGERLNDRAQAVVR
jgi:peptide/nickel transport system permease protein